MPESDFSELKKSLGPAGNSGCLLNEYKLIVIDAEQTEKNPTPVTEALRVTFHELIHHRYPQLSENEIEDLSSAPKMLATVLRELGVEQALRFADALEQAEKNISLKGERQTAPGKLL